MGVFFGKPRTYSLDGGDVGAVAGCEGQLAGRDGPVLPALADLELSTHWQMLR